jgi:hypothetical protein
MKTLKTFLSTTLAFCFTLGVGYSQGTVQFDTKAVGARVFYVYPFNPGPAIPATGNNPLSNVPFYGQLYAAPGQNASVDSLQPVSSPLPFSGSGNPASSNAGYLQAVSAVTVTPIGGGPATIQLRAWTGGDTYEEALAAVNLGVFGSGVGESPLLNLASTGDPNSAPELVGLTGFTFNLTIPEPSTYSLLAGGLIFLGISRSRKKSA